MRQNPNRTSGSRIDRFEADSASNPQKEKTPTPNRSSADASALAIVVVFVLVACGGVDPTPSEPSNDEPSPPESMQLATPPPPASHKIATDFTAVESEPYEREAIEGSEICVEIEHTIAHSTSTYTVSPAVDALPFGGLIRLDENLASDRWELLPDLGEGAYSDVRVWSSCPATRSQTVPGWVPDIADARNRLVEDCESSARRFDFAWGSRETVETAARNASGSLTLFDVITLSGGSNRPQDDQSLTFRDVVLAETADTYSMRSVDGVALTPEQLDALGLEPEQVGVFCGRTDGRIIHFSLSSRHSERALDEFIGLSLGSTGTATVGHEETTRLDDLRVQIHINGGGRSTAEAIRAIKEGHWWDLFGATPAEELSPLFLHVCDYWYRPLYFREVTDIATIECYAHPDAAVRACPNGERMDPNGAYAFAWCDHDRGHESREVPRDGSGCESGSWENFEHRGQRGDLAFSAPFDRLVYASAYYFVDEPTTVAFDFQVSPETGIWVWVNDVRVVDNGPAGSYEVDLPAGYSHFELTSERGHSPGIELFSLGEIASQVRAVNSCASW